MNKYYIIILLLFLSINLLNSQDIKDSTDDTEILEEKTEIDDEIIITKDSTNDILTDDLTSDNKKETITEKEDETTDAADIKEKLTENEDTTNDIEKKENKKKKKKFVFIKNKNRPIIFKNQIYIYNLNTLNKIGIIFCPTGITLMLTGTALFLYDYFFYIRTLESSASYDEYMTNYIIDIALLASGLSAAGLGICLFAISIPFIIYKKKNKDVSIYINPGLNTSIGLSYKFY